MSAPGSDGRSDAPVDLSGIRMLRCPACDGDLLTIAASYTFSCPYNGWPADPEDDGEALLPMVVVGIDCAFCGHRSELQVATVDGQTGVWLDSNHGGA